MTLPKDESTTPSEAATDKGASSVKKGKRKKKEVELDESDTTRGSLVVIPTPHRTGKKPAKFPSNHKQAGKRVFNCMFGRLSKHPPNELTELVDPPVFWTEVYSTLNKKWITIDPVRGFVNAPLKMHPATTCSTNNLAYVVAYDEGII